MLVSACDAGRAPFRQLDSTSARVPVNFRSSVGLHAMQGARIRDGVARAISMLSTMVHALFFS